MKPIRFAVVGVGRIGQRHCELISHHDQAELVAAVDVDTQKSNQVTNTYGVLFYSSLNQLLQNGPQVDVVNICTPNDLHTQHSIQVLQSGCHVVCEKPMGLTSEQCQRVINTANETGLKVFCVMQNRYSPPSKWLKDVVSRELLGRILMVQINCYWNRSDDYYTSSAWKGTIAQDGGPLFTQFSHFVDTLLWLFGDITDIHARFANYTHQKATEFEDSGLVTFRLQNGGMGAFNYSNCTWQENLESSITILGEKGTVKVSGQYMNKLVHCSINDYEQPELPPSNPPNAYGNYQGSAANHLYVIDNVVQTLRNNSQETANAREGMKVVETVERIYKDRKSFL